MRRGTERFAHDLAAGLVARGQRPVLVTSHKGAPSTRVEDGFVVRRNWRPPERWLWRLGFEGHLTHPPLTLGSLGRVRPDVAHALHHADALAAGRWGARTGRPSVFSFMGIPLDEGFGYRRLLGPVMRRAVHGTDRLVVLSQAAAERFERLLGVQAIVIPPGVDTRIFTPGGARAEGPVIFCAADAGEPRKRVPLLVEAFRSVRRSLPAARLVLSRPRAGDALRLGAVDGVELRDVDDTAMLRDAYREALVSVLPSYSEAFGLVLLESLACGTPVVGSNRDGIPELVDRESVGTVFDGDEPWPLARALLDTIELARDPGTAGTCRARAEDLSQDRCVERYLALYRELT